MIPEELKYLIEQINQLHVDEKEKANLLKRIGGIKKAFIIADFKIKRTEKDKFITTNLLETSVKELENHQVAIEETNRKLKEQKEKVEAKNIELRKQKLVVDHQSRQLKANLEDLEVSYNEMEQFTYIASHDLKSPLQTISNFANLLHSRYQSQLDDQGKDFLHFITKGTKQMSNVINDLLEFSRVGRKGNQFEKVGLNTVLDAVLFNLHLPIEKSKATIAFGSLPEMYINKSGMIQLFQNLIGNAIKFRSDRPCHVQISIEQTDGFIIFNVKDNGLGMDEAFQSKAFLPFQRVNNLDRPGTGIGLAICKKVVKLHKGKISFKSTINEGTTFTFSISTELGSI